MRDKFVDSSASTRAQIDESDPLAAWRTINYELELFDPELAPENRRSSSPTRSTCRREERGSCSAKKLPSEYRPLHIISGATDGRRDRPWSY